MFPVDIGKVPMFAIDTQQLPYNDLKQEARQYVNFPHLTFLPFLFLCCSCTVGLSLTPFLVSQLHNNV